MLSQPYSRSVYLWTELCLVNGLCVSPTISVASCFGETEVPIKVSRDNEFLPFGRGGCVLDLIWSIKMHRCSLPQLFRRYSTVWLLLSQGGLKLPTHFQLARTVNLATSSILCAHVVFFSKILCRTHLGRTKQVAITQWKSLKCVWHRSKWDTRKRWPLNSTGQQRHCIGPHGNRMCSTLSEYTDSEHFSIPTSSSISLTAGESENNGATHNTMAGYQQWPHGTINSSRGYFIFSQREFWLSQHPHGDSQTKLKSKSQTQPSSLCKVRHNLVTQYTARVRQCASSHSTFIQIERSLRPQQNTVQNSYIQGQSGL